MLDPRSDTPVADPASSRRGKFDPDDPEICRKREALFNGLVGKNELGAIIRKSPRTVDRLIRRGMPYTDVLGETMFDLEAVRAWLSALARTSPRSLAKPQQERPPPRGRGRPRIYPRRD